MIWIVTSSCSHNFNSSFSCKLKTNFWIWICESKDDGLFSHSFDHGSSDDSSDREANKDIRAFEGLGEAVGEAGADVDELAALFDEGVDLVREGVGGGVGF